MTLTAYKTSKPMWPWRISFPADYQGSVFSEDLESVAGDLVVAEVQEEVALVEDIIFKSSAPCVDQPPVAKS